MVVPVSAHYSNLLVLNYGISLQIILVYEKLVVMCVNPFDIVIESRVSGKNRAISVPCGKCVECLKTRQNDWKIRITKECERWSHVYFFTLTYRDSTLPCNVCYNDVYDEVLFHGTKPDCEFWRNLNAQDACIYSTVDFDDVRRWLKRFRTSYERNNGCKWNVKYFICSEYGPNPNGTKRPHYHGIFMTDIDYNTLLPMFNEWSEMYGLMQFDECGIKREDKSSVANYVSKYCAKGCFESRAEDIKEKRIKRAYSCVSKNIGLAWIQEHANDWLKYVPSFLSVDTEWDLDIITEFFERLKISSPYDYSNFMSELDNLLINLKIYDGKKFGYSFPRYYFNVLFGKRINDVKPQLVTKNGKPVCNLKPFLQSVLTSEHGCERYAHFAYACIPQPVTFVTKMAKNSRYVSTSFLSAAIAYRLRMQFFAKSAERARALVEQGCTEDEAYHILLLRQKAANHARKHDAETKLSNFYITNMWKNRSLDFDADTFDNQSITNY